MLVLTKKQYKLYHLINIIIDTLFLIIGIIWLSSYYLEIIFILGLCMVHIFKKEVLKEGYHNGYTKTNN